MYNKYSVKKIFKKLQLIVVFSAANDVYDTNSSKEIFLALAKRISLARHPAIIQNSFAAYAISLENMSVCILVVRCTNGFNQSCSLKSDIRQLELYFIKYLLDHCLAT